MYIYVHGWVVGGEEGGEGRRWAAAAKQQLLADASYHTCIRAPPPPHQQQHTQHKTHNTEALGLVKPSSSQQEDQHDPSSSSTNDEQQKKKTDMLKSLLTPQTNNNDDGAQSSSSAMELDAEEAQLPMLLELAKGQRILARALAALPPQQVGERERGVGMGGLSFLAVGERGGGRMGGVLLFFLRTKPTFFFKIRRSTRPTDRVHSPLTTHMLTTLSLFLSHVIFEKNTNQNNQADRLLAPLLGLLLARPPPPPSTEQGQVRAFCDCVYRCTYMCWYACE